MTLNCGRYLKVRRRDPNQGEIAWGIYVRSAWQDSLRYSGVGGPTFCGHALGDTPESRAAVISRSKMEWTGIVSPPLRIERVTSCYHDDPLGLRVAGYHGCHEPWDVENLIHHSSQDSGGGGGRPHAAAVVPYECSLLQFGREIAQQELGSNSEGELSWTFGEPSVIHLCVVGAAWKASGHHRAHWQWKIDSSESLASNCGARRVWHSIVNHTQTRACGRVQDCIRPGVKWNHYVPRACEVLADFFSQARCIVSSLHRLLVQTQAWPV